MLYETSNGDEGFIFTPQSTVELIGLEAYIASLFPALGEGDIEKAIDLYTKTGADVASAASKVMSEGVSSPFAEAQSLSVNPTAIFTCPGYATLDAFLEAGKPAWKGLFDVPPAWHGNDLLYTFEA